MIAAIRYTVGRYGSLNAGWTARGYKGYKYGVGRIGLSDILPKVNEVITMKENGVPIWEKVMLTVEEASQYSNIGVNKISSLLNEPGCSFLFCVGKGKRLVKRKEFEKFIEKTLEV